MGNSASTESASEIAGTTTPAQTSEVVEEVVKKSKCKACCACPETKKVRDECIVNKGEDQCGDLIEKHKQCMRDMGFKI